MGKPHKAPRTVLGARASAISASPSGSKAAFRPLEPGGPRCTPGALDAEAPPTPGATQSGPLALFSDADPGPPSPSRSQHPRPPRRCQECAPTERWPAARLQPGVSPTREPGQEGTKGSQEREPAAGRAASLPATLRIGPRDSVAPGARPRRSPGARAAGATGRAAMRTARFRGFDPTDAGRDPG